jgi:hypothetical protein
LLIIIVKNFNLYSVEKTILYYQNTVSFLSGKKDVKTYQSFFDKKTPRDYDVVAFIKNHTRETDRVFIWGNSAQIYSLSNKLPVNKYVVAYHITQNKNGIADTQKAIDSIQPRYIITLSEAPSIPFYLPMYSSKYAISGTAIYERNY